MGFFKSVGDFFKGPGGIAAAVNPVGLLGTGLAMGDSVMGYLGAEADRKSEEARFRDQMLEDRYQRDRDRQLQESVANRNFQMQEDFAKQGVRWRVADAEAAGLHPLAALGVMPTGSSPVSVMGSGGAGYSGGPSSSRGGNMYRALSAAGQNISRAMLAGQSADERALAQAQLDKLRSETDYMTAMAAESRKRASMPGNPPIPDPYSGVSGGDVRTVPDMHQVMRGPNGYEVQWSDAYSRSQMSRPFSMAGNDLVDILKNAIENVKRGAHNVRSGWSSQNDQMRRYYGGGR